MDTNCCVPLCKNRVRYIDMRFFPAPNYYSDTVCEEHMDLRCQYQGYGDICCGELAYGNSKFCKNHKCCLLICNEKRQSISYDEFMSQTGRECELCCSKHLQ